MEEEESPVRRGPSLDERLKAMRAGDAGPPAKANTLTVDISVRTLYSHEGTRGVMLKGAGGRSHPPYTFIPVTISAAPDPVAVTVAVTYRLADLPDGLAAIVPKRLSLKPDAAMAALQSWKSWKSHNAQPSTSFMKKLWQGRSFRGSSTRASEGDAEEYASRSWVT